MGFMSFLRDDRVALIGMAIAAAALISSMMAVVSMVIEDNKIERPEPKTQYITQETEDSLQLDTLEKLINHPSYSIREVAVKILCDRAVNDADTIHILLHGITRKDYGHRLRCLKALALLLSQTGEAPTTFDSLKTYGAMVRSLEIGLDDVERPKLDDPYFDEYYLRDMAERTNLLLIYQLIQKNGAAKLLMAKFVERWLAKQNWGDSENEIHENFKMYTEGNKSNPIRGIVDCIRTATGGLETLRNCGLVAREETPPYRGEVWGITFSTVPRGSDEDGVRDSELSADEIRRLRREAFVFNDGTRPVSRLDIVERTNPH
ncbi:Uncharacterized protein SAPIO_CDS3320 [Scedosporium apiospermum]|uniref:Cytoskeleton-associated protein n=1 Tax=Pseudallescheria apiosperma TaxID=563466 RepID=A0A084GAH9_PSEDA|nr:Uncharacterized protein SAPIO_CDS3320 [Scedosporium apiospermum]KEZ44341.1 Uncharacterized protein SAPIO_CDS3320 [Scedosporium apiospermum]